jgi:hypothetical protein
MNRGSTHPNTTTSAETTSPGVSKRLHSGRDTNAGEAELGGADDEALVAAALLWRVFYSVLTLPLGAITLSRFRKANPDLPGGGMAETPVA